MADNSVRGRFVWHELMTTNTKSGADFFAKVVGWKTKVSDENPSYSMFTMNGRPMAGLMALPDDAKAMGTPPCWVTYIGTPNVDETVTQAVSLGGKVLKAAADIPTIGRFAVLQDPQGAVFLAFTPLQQMGAPTNAVPVIGDFSWHELATADWRAGLTFYQQLFGWEETSSMDMGPGMGTYQMFGLNGQTFGGVFTKPSQMPGPPFWLPYIKVADSKKAAATTTRLGGRVLNGPMEVPGGDWIVQGMDFEGAAFAVHSVKAVEQAKPVAKKKAAAKAKPAAKKKTAKKKATVTKTAAARKSVAKKGAKKTKKAAATKRTKSKAKPMSRRR